MNAILSFLQKLNSHQSLMPKCSRICQCQQMEFHSQQRKRTGRSQGYGQTFKDFKLRERKVERTFMAEYMRTHGSTSSSGIQIVVGTRGQRHPQLTSGRRRNMTALFLNTLPNLISAEEVLKDVLIIKIELPEFFHEMLVHWRATGNAETDQNIAHRLRSNAKKLHKQMQENFYGIRLPVIKFVPDRQHLNIQEMESHFRSADYGENYQAVCNVAVPSEPLPPNDEKSQKPPWWLESWRRRVKTSQKEEKPMTAHTDVEENDTKVAALIAAEGNKELT